MNIEQLKLDLMAESPEHWSIRDGKLMYMGNDGNIAYFYDHIEITGFLPFRKLTLVANNQIIPLGFFEKRKLYKLVDQMFRRVDTYNKWEALKNIRVVNEPNLPKSRFQQRLEDMQRQRDEAREKQLSIKKSVQEAIEETKWESDFDKRLHAEKERIRRILKENR